MGALSVVLGMISLWCQYYIRFLENDPIDTLEELGGHGMVQALIMFLIIGMSLVGAVLGLCALYKRAIVVGLTGLIMNLTFLIKTIADFLYFKKLG
jgi:hypothetical protein